MTRTRLAVAWTALAGMAITAVSPWPGRISNRPLSAVRSLMPWSALTAVPMSIGALVTGQRRLAAAAGVVGAAAVAMATPMIVPRRQHDVDPTAHPLRVVHANLMYVNRRLAALPDALAAVGPDVVTFSELTPTHHRRLLTTSLNAAYPHQAAMPASAASGTGLWSRYPITVRSTSATMHHTVVADVHAPGGTVRIIVIHPQSPISDHANWVRDLEQLADLRTTGPAVMTGDCNASWWHPELRRLMRRGGWRDAHQVLGHGLSCSWPTDQWHPAFRLHPPFTRLDHAFVNDGLRVLDAGGFDIPGSDHRGVSVTVQRVSGSPSQGTSATVVGSTAHLDRS